MTYLEYLLGHLIEECTEIQKAASKSQRFGLMNYWEKEGKVNIAALGEELGDLAFIVEELQTIGVHLSSGTKDRRARFTEMLALSKRLGCVDERVFRECDT